MIIYLFWFVSTTTSSTLHSTGQVYLSLGIRVWAIMKFHWSWVAIYGGDMIVLNMRCTSCLFFRASSSCRWPIKHIGGVSFRHQTRGLVQLPARGRKDRQARAHVRSSQPLWGCFCSSPDTNTSTSLSRALIHGGGFFSVVKHGVSCGQLWGGTTGKTCFRRRGVLFSGQS